MTNFTTKTSRIRVSVWSVWFLVIWVSLSPSASGMATASTTPQIPPSGSFCYTAWLNVWLQISTV